MAVHTLAYMMTLRDLTDRQIADLKDAGRGFEVYVNPVPDPALSSSTATGFFVPRGMHVTAVHATAWIVGLKTGGGDLAENPIDHAQLEAPSLLRLAPPLVRPLAAAPGCDQPGVQLLTNQAIAINENEVLQAKVRVQVSADLTDITSFVLSVVVFLNDKVVAPPSDGQLFWIGGPFEGTTAQPGKWTTLAWPTGTGGLLPDGRYALMAVEHWSLTAVAARVQFAGGIYRPGVISVRGKFERTHEAFYECRFGVLGLFSSFALPQFEVLCTDADTLHNVTYAVMRVG